MVIFYRTSIFCILGYIYEYITIIGRGYHAPTGTLMYRLRILFLFLFVFALSCSQKKEIKAPISDEKFVNFYTDYMILQDENKFLALDSLASLKRFDSLYQVYGITKQQVETTRAEYNKDLGKWQSTYEKILARLDSLQMLKKPNSPFK